MSTLNRTINITVSILLLITVGLTFFSFQVHALAQNKKPTNSLELFNNFLDIFLKPLPTITIVNSDNSATPSPQLTQPVINTTNDIVLVQRLIGQIYSTCGPTVNKDIIQKTNCLDNYPYPLNMAVPAFVESTITKNFYHLQCVGFVKGLVKMTTGIDWGDVAGRAKGLLDAPPSGYYPIDRDDTSSGPIQPGDLAIFNYDTYGHIAYVMNVDPSGKSFLIAEANSNGKGLVQINSRPFSINNPALEGWLRRSQ